MLTRLKPFNCIVIIFASLLQAFGIYNIHAVSSVTEGGVLGATLLIRHLSGISPAVSSLILNTVCYALGWKTLGKNFIACSVLSICTYSLGYAVCELLPPLWPQIAQMPLTAAIAGALFIGIGAGLCVKAGGATSGDDALAMSLSHITKIDIQWIYLVSDLTVLLLSLSYVPLGRIAYSLLTVVLSGQIIGFIQKIPIKSTRAASI